MELLENILHKDILPVEAVNKVPQLNQSLIDPQAFNIVRSLQQKDFTTYLVGGCVRDLLLGLHPKDFDIATSAKPSQVNKVVRPSYVIGRRFRLVLVKRSGRQYEISTFRAQTEQLEENGGLITDDNTFGSPEEDARRRDFTINSLFYDPIGDKLIDYTDGMRDIEERTVRIIGDPGTRINEDPIRILRALRFSHRTGFSIEPNLRQAIVEQAPKLAHSVLPRKREEFLKMLRLRHPLAALWEAADLNVLQNFVPSLHQLIASEEGDEFCKLFQEGIPYITDSENTYEQFAVLLFAMVAAKDPDFPDRLKVREKIKNFLAIFLKDEIGMFRAEQDLFYGVLSLLLQLREIKNPQTLKPKFRDHLARNNRLGIALTLAAAYKLLSSQDLYYWLDQYWQIQQAVRQS